MRATKPQQQEREHVLSADLFQKATNSPKQRSLVCDAQASHDLKLFSSVLRKAPPHRRAFQAAGAQAPGEEGTNAGPCLGTLAHLWAWGSLHPKP